MKVLISLSTATYKRIFFIDCANEVWINGLRFIGCGSNKFSSIKRFTIENSTSQGQDDSGTAIDITDTNLTVINSSFLSNKVGTCNKIDTNISVGIGGAILANNSKVIIRKCKFLKNNAEMGGAMYIRYRR